MHSFSRPTAVSGRFRPRSRLSLAVALALLPLASALSSAPEAGDQVVQVPATVVTATGFPSGIDELGSSISVVTAEDIARHQWRTLPQILRGIPGLGLTQVGGPGGAATIFIRGANSNHTKVLIDGVAVNNPSVGGVFDFSHILASDIERVEVLRGPQSGLYGSDAIGGVINIITKKGAGPARIEASVEGGSFGTFNQTAALRGAGERFSYNVDASHFHADKAVTPLELLPPGARRNDDRYDNVGVSTRLGFDASEVLGFDFSARAVKSRLDYTGDDFSVYPSVPASRQSRQQDRDLFAQAGLRLTLLDGAFDNRFRVSHARFRSEIQDPDTDFGPTPPVFNRGSRTSQDWQGTLSFAAGRKLALGLENTIERLDRSPVSASNDNQAAFAELQWRVVDALSVNASFRHDDHERFGGQNTWRFAPSWTLPGIGMRLKASYGTGFKAPSLTQLYVDYPSFNFFANPDLKPERSRGWDAGFEQDVNSGHVRFGATYFRNRIEDLIDNNASFTSYINLGKANTHGLESFVAVDVGDRLSLRADHTRVVARDAATSLELLRRPRDKTSLDATWQVADGLVLTATALRVGPWVDGNRDFSVPRMRAAGYTLLNIAAEYAFDERFALFGRIDNLTDKRYEEPIGFLHPRRGFFVGVRGSFGG